MATQVHPSPGVVRSVAAAEAIRAVESGEVAQVIDVRSPDEYATGHIPGAVNVPLDEVETRLGDLAPGQVLVVCQSGQRAEMACELIGRAHGGLLRLDGGTDAWLQAGGPVVASRKVRWSLERQVRLGAGLLVLLGVALGWLVHPGWFGVAAFIGAGLTFSGLTGFCGMAKILALMPWNRPAAAGDDAARS
ncbi:MAG: rhodanese-like domain-containing protein [Armatimonadota bacterium]